MSQNSDQKLEYLKNHPEIKYLVTTFIQETIYLQPNNIVQFGKQFFQNEKAQDYIASKCGFDTANEHLRSIFFKIAQEAEAKRKKEEEILAQQKREQEEKDRAAQQLEIQRKMLESSSESYEEYYEEEQEESGDIPNSQERQRNIQNEYNTDKIVITSDTYNQIAMIQKPEKLVQQATIAPVEKKEFNYKQKVIISIKNTAQLQQKVKTQQQSQEQISQLREQTDNIQTTLQKMRKKVKRRTKKEEDPKQQFIETKYEEEPVEIVLDVMSFEEKLHYYCKLAAPGVDNRALHDCGATISIWPTIQELICDPDKLAVVLITQYTIGRGLKIMPSDGYVDGVPFKPHILGVGLREFGLFSKLLKHQMIKIITNIDDTVSSHVQSTLNYIGDASRAFRVLEGRFNKTNYPNVLKYVPLVFKGNAQNKSVDDMLLIVCSFLPPKSCNNFLFDVTLTTKEVESEDLKFQQYQKMLEKVKDFDHQLNVFLENGQKKLQNKQIEEKDLLEEYESKRKLEPKCEMPRFPQLKPLSNQAELIKEQCLQMLKETDEGIYVKQQNILFTTISTQKINDFPEHLIKNGYDNPQYFFDFGLYAKGGILTKSSMNEQFVQKFKKEYKCMFQILNRQNQFMNIQKFKNYETFDTKLRSIIVGEENITDLKRILEFSSFLCGICNLDMSEPPIFMFRKLQNCIIDRAMNRNVLQHITAQMQLMIREPVSLLLSRNCFWNSILESGCDVFQNQQHNLFYLTNITNQKLRNQFPDFFTTKIYQVELPTKIFIQLMNQINTENDLKILSKSKSDLFCADFYVSNSQIFKLSQVQRRIFNQFGEDIFQNQNCVNQFEINESNNQQLIKFGVDEFLLTSRFGNCLKSLIEFQTEFLGILGEMLIGNGEGELFDGIGYLKAVGIEL